MLMPSGNIWHFLKVKHTFTLPIQQVHFQVFTQEKQQKFKQNFK